MLVCIPGSFWKLRVIFGTSPAVSFRNVSETLSFMLPYYLYFK